ncbi:hypothetical protein Glove_319g60 [Diversispora epigaea]|uniref:Uncharacterized protein n=1 Tax=Diversispora epigaea TaxID=1348612 RepID=A0A397HPF1_9GLOM|nr:hypothetical protein Glove_319g60 [Diversispora epigaea]
MTGRKIKLEKWLVSKKHKYCLNAMYHRRSNRSNRSSRSNCDIIVINYVWYAPVNIFYVTHVPQRTIIVICSTECIDQSFFRCFLMSYGGLKLDCVTSHHIFSLV